jgi:CheY-like chemotaxis protein
MGERKRQVLVIDDQEEAAEVELVAVNGYARPEDRRRAADAGFDAHLAKPIDLDVLERMLARDAPNI